jgi:hypothetical protein
VLNEPAIGCFRVEAIGKGLGKQKRKLSEKKNLICADDTSGRKNLQDFVEGSVSE